MKPPVARGAPVRSLGFVLPSAIFLVVILAALAAFLVNIFGAQNLTSAQDVQGARAYQAARAGVEWGLYQVLDPGNATAVAPAAPGWPNMPPCQNANLNIEGFTVQVQCAASPLYAEAGNTRRIQVYRITATASLGVVGTAGYVERQVAATVSKCRSVDGMPPAFECS